MRLGGTVAKDMIAVPIGPDMRMAVVAAPSYFAKRPRPQIPQDLTAHDCINLRLPTHGGLYAWEFEKDGRELRVRVDGQLVFNNAALILDAALAGFGLAYLPEDQVRAHLGGGWSGCSTNGARPFRATISTIRAVAKTLLLLTSWSTPFDTGEADVGWRLPRRLTGSYDQPKQAMLRRPLIQPLPRASVRPPGGERPRLSRCRLWS